MCILCVIQKWSRKVATMLPWLVIPLIGLWLLSQFLPPAFRFEITSPRLACVLVLLATLFWYEILMPQLSTWRTRRNARIKEKKRLEIIEMHKLKKNAIRKCRNCRTPYRDQNPCGGKFNCSYCGHVSKRPLFDPSLSPGLDRSGNFIDFFGRVWSENNWICGQDWLETGGCYVNGSFSGKSGYGKNNSGGYYNSGNDNIFSFLLVFVCKSFAAIFLGVIWLIRKLFRISFSEDDDASTDSDIVGLAKKGEDGVNCNETRSEKARRKMEEKRQARLEKEQLEEEERKQREEVARLVEERRKIRDENDRRYKVPPRVKSDKKEARKNQQERNKEQDRGSSKSSSDVDELEKRACKEIKRNKKGETESREHHKTVNENVSRSNNHNKGSVGARYLDRVRGNLFPSSTATGGGLFGKGTNVPAYTSNTRERKSSASSDHATKRDVVQPERAHKKSNGHADDQNQNRPAHFEPQPCPPPKRSWHQLFSRSSPTASSTCTNVISRPSGNSQTEVQSSVASGVPMIQGFDTPISVAFPFPLSNTSFGNSTNSTGLQLLSNPTELPKEPNSSEQRYYDPDPTSLIGPVSESLDNFQLEHGFVPDLGFKKPSPIESCVSPLWNSDEKDASSFFSPSSREKTNLPVENDSTTNENGWQMWNSPICPDTLGLVGGNATWYLPQRTQEKTKFPLEEHVLPNTNGFVHPSCDDPWGLRASYGSISTSNNSLSFNQRAGITHNELVYGIPSGSSIHHPFHPYHGSVWAKNEKGASPVCAKGVRTTSTMIAPSGGLYSPSDVQSLWSYD